MAFNTQEQELIKYGVQNGKSRQEVETALFNLRTGVAPTPTAPVTVGGLSDGQDGPGLLQRIGTDIQSRGAKNTEILNTPDDGSFLSDSTQGLKLAANTAGGVTGVLGEIIKSIPGGQAALDAIGGVASAGFKALTSKLSGTKLFSEAAEGDTAKLESYLSIGQSLGEVAGNVLAAQSVASGARGVANAIKVAANKTGQAVTNVVDRAVPLARDAYGRSKELIKPSQTPTKAIGEVLQAKKPITPRDVNAFKSINIEGVKTYTGLDKRITESIGKLSDDVDNALGQDPTSIPLSKLSTKVTSAGGKVLERNFVQTGLDNLKELYIKTADDLGASNIDDLLQKANTSGLTRLEVNNISRLYNQEFGTKAFSKMGDPLTSVNAQAYENIRTGLKNVARQGMGGSEAAATDKIVSSLYNTRKLVRDNVAAVQRLEQRIAERGLLEKVGNSISKYGDILTGGSIRGFIGGLLPRGAGYKVLNALDLEERLANNLKVIQGAIASGSDDAIVNATKGLSSSLSGHIATPIGLAEQITNKTTGQVAQYVANGVKDVFKAGTKGVLNPKIATRIVDDIAADLSPVAAQILRESVLVNGTTAEQIKAIALSLSKQL